MQILIMFADKVLKISALIEAQLNLIYCIIYLCCHNTRTHKHKQIRAAEREREGERQHILSHKFEHVQIQNVPNVAKYEKPPPTSTHANFEISTIILLLCMCVCVCAWVAVCVCFSGLQRVTTTTTATRTTRINV